MRMMIYADYFNYDINDVIFIHCMVVFKHTAIIFVFFVKSVI